MLCLLAAKRKSRPFLQRRAFLRRMENGGSDIRFFTCWPYGYGSTGREVPRDSEPGLLVWRKRIADRASISGRLEPLALVPEQQAPLASAGLALC